MLGVCIHGTCQFLFLLCFKTKVYLKLHRLYNEFTILFCRKFHAIPKVDRNLMDLKLQSLFVNLMIIEVILDQVKNILIQNYYEQLGIEDVFFLWWLSFYFENFGKIPMNITIRFHFFKLKTILGLRLIFNLVVYYTAKKRLPEFSGFCGRSFPIENSHRTIKLLPRGQELPASFDKDWRDIGFTRLTPSPIHIIVTPAE